MNLANVLKTATALISILPWFLGTTILANVGGNLKWELKVSDSRGSSREITAVGDDGVVVMRVSDGLMEIGLGPEGTPFSRSLGLYEKPARPFARVNEKTLINLGSAIVAIGNQTLIPEATIAIAVSQNSSIQPPHIAIGKTGDVFVLSLAEPPSLQRWSSGGVLKFQTVLPKFGPIASGTMVLTADDTSIISSHQGKLYAVSAVGAVLWTRDQVGSVLMATSTGGSIVWDRWGRLLKLTSDGFPEATFSRALPYSGLSSTDIPLQNLFLGNSNDPIYVRTTLLADGGWVVVSNPFSSSGFVRLSASGSILWSAPSEGFLALDTFYHFDERPDGLWVKAIYLGAPLADSSWPNLSGWPDGSRRGRARKSPIPFLTMLHHSPQEGAFLQFGTEPGRQYVVESGDQAGSPWTEVGRVVADTFGVQWIDRSAAPDTHRIYRVRLN